MKNTYGITLLFFICLSLVIVVGAIVLFGSADSQAMGEENEESMEEDGTEKNISPQDQDLRLNNSENPLSINSPNAK